MRVGDEQRVDPVVFLGRRGLLAARRRASARGTRTAAGSSCSRCATASPPCRCGVIRSSVSSSVALCSIWLRTAPSLLWPNSALDRAEFVADDGRHTLRRGRGCRAGRRSRAITSLVFVDDLVLLEAGQALQAHLQDFLRLVVGQAVEAVGLHAELARAGRPGGTSHGRRPCRLRRARSISRTSLPNPTTWLISSCLGDRRRRRGLDDRDELVDVGQRHRQAFQHVAALARLAQLEHGAAGDHLAAVLQERPRSGPCRLQQLAAGRRPAPPC